MSNKWNKMIFIFALIIIFYCSCKSTEYKRKTIFGSKKESVCEKIESDVIRTTTSLRKAVKDYIRASKDHIKVKDIDSRTWYRSLTLMDRAKENESKAYAGVSKSLSDMIKYRCLKESSACLESLKDLIQNLMYSSKISNVRANYGRGNISNEDYFKALRNESKADDNSLYISNNIRKYCSKDTLRMLFL